MSPGIHVAGPDDVVALAQIHAASFELAWSADFFRSVMERAGAIALLAYGHQAQDPQGFLLLQVAATESEILSIATLPASRRCGIAKALLVAGAASAARHGARELFLEVASDNIAANALYAGLKFLPVGRRPTYYVRGTEPAADALILRAALPLKIHGNGPRSRLD